MWCKAYRTVVIQKVPGVPLCIGVIMACLKSVGISPVFREALYSSWWGWARLLLHCLRSIAGNSSGPPEEFCEIVFIESMMSSLVILMSESIFACGCLKRSSEYTSLSLGPKCWRGYCIVHSVVRSFFLLLGSKFPSSSWRGPIPVLIVELFFKNL